MELRIFVEPQRGTTYQQLRTAARRAEERGFAAFLCADHYAPVTGGTGLPGPLDTWITLAGLALETSTIRLGTLMSAATFRLPGPLAVMSAQVDQMSAGRLEVGLGTGWAADEHTAFGIPLPDTATRFERLAEQLTILTGAWTTPAGREFSFTGKHYQLAGGAPAPRPVQRPGPPLIIGGVGNRRTPALAARFAAEFNLPFPDARQALRQFESLTLACAAIGRNPATIARSVVLGAFVDTTSAAVDRRVALAGPDADLVAATGVVGSPDQAVDTLGRWRERGADRVCLHLADVTDFAQLDLIAATVMPQLAGATQPAQT